MCSPVNKLSIYGSAPVTSQKKGVKKILRRPYGRRGSTQGNEIQRRPLRPSGPSGSLIWKKKEKRKAFCSAAGLFECRLKIHKGQINRQSSSADIGLNQDYYVSHWMWKPGKKQVKSLPIGRKLPIQNAPRQRRALFFAPPQQRSSP